MSYLFFPVNCSAAPRNAASAFRHGDKVKQATRYSKVAALVITRSIETDYLMQYPYIITHAASGRSVARLATLRNARKALALLLPLTDWTASKEELEYDTILAREVRHTLSDFDVHVANR